jgi:hypothetical protein
VRRDHVSRRAVDSGHSSGLPRVSHNTCLPLSPSPHANNFVIGPAVINNNLQRCDAPATIMARQFCKNN